MELTGLKAVWGPEVKALDDRQVIAFLRRWAGGHTWPPSLHEFLSGMGVAKVTPTSPTHTVRYRCEHCGEELQGYQAYGSHVDAQHPDQAADPEVVAAMISDWRAKRNAAKSRDLESGDPAVAESTPAAPDPSQGAPDLKPKGKLGAPHRHPERDVSGEPPPL